MTDNTLLKQLIQLTTDDRFDQSKIDIPAFNNPVLDAKFPVATCERHFTGRRLPIDYAFFAEYSVSDWIAGVAAPEQVLSRRLGTLLNLLVRVQRFEPENHYKMHTLSPSARCIFPYVFEIELCLDGRVRRYRYHAQYHTLETLSDCPSTSSSRLSVICSAKYWKYAINYGEFCPVLVNLETGSLKTLCEWLLRAQGFIPVRCVSNTGVQASSFEREMFRFDAQIDSVTDDLFDLSEVEGTEAEFADEAALRARFARLHKFIDGFHAAEPSTASSSNDVSTTQIGTSPSSLPTGSFYELLNRRSSANDISGVTSLILNRGLDAFWPVLDIADQLRSEYNDTQATASFVHESLVFLQGKTPQEIGFYNVRNRQRLNVDCHIDALLDAAMPNKMLKINFHSMAAIALIHVDLADLATDGKDALRRLHQCAGARMLQISVAAAAQGMFCRPVRVLLESALTPFIGEDQKIVFQLAFGYVRRTNMRFEL